MKNIYAFILIFAFSCSKIILIPYATLGKKIRICTLPIPVNHFASLVAKPSIVLHEVFGLDVKENIKVYLSKEDLGYNFSYNSADNTKATFNLLTSKPLDFGIEAINLTAKYKNHHNWE